VRTSILVAAVAVTTALATSTSGAALAAPADPAAAAPTARYVVLGADGGSTDRTAAAVRAAGGRVVGSTPAIGVVTAESADPAFAAAVRRQPGVAGAARDRSIGRVPALGPAKPDPVNAEPAAATRARAAAGRTGRAATPAASPTEEPLAPLQWNMRMVKADQAYGINPGSRRVLVGIIDSGLDASNPDLAANFDASRSRNFASDIPAIDGPCEYAGCVDPIGVDDNGHGTHVAGIVAAALNGVGVAGVAPGVTLVEARAGQDSGFVFLNPVLSALTYSADTGVDVVNMSFYIDPWLFNCRSNPADSPEAQAEQRATIAAVTRAMNYAHRKGVTQVVSLGNNHFDLGNPPVDTSSPDYPEGQAYPRTIDNADCLILPIEGPHAIGVSALGPSGRKADYSNYGLEQITVSAPGGWFRDYFGTPAYRTDANLVLSTYPRNVLQLQGRVDPEGNVVPGFENSVFKSCTAAGQCGYYAYLQGTSMAAPHATGVAALIVSRYGHRDRRGGLTLAPGRVASILTRSAAEQACPASGVETYRNEGRDASYDAPCVGTPSFNSLYGHGIVDALAAVAGPFGRG
jgi:subtilisin family serine protease